MMDNPAPINLPEILRAIATVDVMVFRFTLLDRRLLFDARSSELEGPLLRLVPRVNSPQERFRNLQTLRPRFPVPENIVAFAWGKSISSLRTDGVWAAVEGRVARSGYPGIQAICHQVYAELLQLEQAERVAALTGKGYRTIWERK